MNDNRKIDLPSWLSSCYVISNVKVANNIKDRPYGDIDNCAYMETMKQSDALISKLC